MSGYPGPDTEPALVLVVDDNPTNRYVLGTTLRRAGHRVVEATDGTTALKLLTEGTVVPEAAIIDVRLPDMTGFTVCEHIKSSPQTASLPVIHISASAITVTDRTQGLMRGADAYLTEPIAPDELLATLAATLRYARARTRAERLATRLHQLNEATLSLYNSQSAKELCHAAATAAARILATEATVLLTAPDGTRLRTTASAHGADVLTNTSPDKDTAGDRVGVRLTSLPAGRWPHAPGHWTGDLPLTVARARAKKGRSPVCVAVPADAIADEDGRDLLAQLGHASALALEALRSYSEEHALALTLQRSFLPTELPRTPTARLAVRYLPANDDTEIGGDFYEALTTEAGLLVAIGDVAGHSLDAAMIMGQVRHALRAYAIEGHPPHEILTRLDRLLNTVRAATAVTLCILLVEPDGRAVHVANAGHLPPVLRAPDGTTRFVNEHGPLLGLGLAHPPAHRVATSPGSSMLMVTDGLVEERGTDLGVSLEALKEAVAHGPAEPEAMCDHVLSSFLQQGEDDIALLAVRLGA